MKQMTRNERLESKRASAKELLEKRAKRTNKQQLAMLDKLFGKGKGAAKERARLNKLIANEKEPVAVAAEEKPVKEKKPRGKKKD